MHFAILTQYYPPEIGAPQARLSDLARRFVERGHHVSVLTAMPSYPQGVLYPGYSGILRREQIDGARVFRTYAYPSQTARFVPRLANYLSFALASAALGPVLLDRADFLLVESPPLLLGLTGVWLSCLKRSRLIVNISDLWPDSPVRLGVLQRGTLAHRVALAIEAFCYRHAWLVTGQSAGILEDIKRRFPKVAQYHLSNGADTARFRRTAQPPEDGGECVALYAGLHGLAQGLDQVLDAAAALKSTTRIRFVLVGDGPQKAALVTRAKQLGLGNVTFSDPLPAEAISGLLAEAHVALVTLKTDLPGAIPSKLYEAMASGRPVVLVARGEPAAIVEEHGAGLVVAPGDVQGLIKALVTLRERPDLRRTLGENGRRAAVQHFDRREIARRFLDFLEASA